MTKWHVRRAAEALQAVEGRVRKGDWDVPFCITRSKARLEGDYYDLKDHIDFSVWLEYFSEGILDELRRVIKSLSEQLIPQPRLELHHQQILDYIREQCSITQREYGAISNRSLAARKLDFEKLVQLNLINVKGVGRGTYYRLITSD